ncbi:MAG: GIY-YIG nuclease family protein [Actinomycetota bacterium]
MKGTYCLILSCLKDFSIPVGKLGIRNFSEGGYVYVGSALNGLENRVARHLAKDKKLFWHIDYLLNSNYAGIDYIMYRNMPERYECPTAKLLAEKLKNCPGFGSSDCKCRSHLFYFEKKQYMFVCRLLSKAGFKLSKPGNWMP